MKFKILNIYKPVDMGSFDVVRKFKRFFGREYKKIGHFGTLDPFAEGVLMLGLGKASKLNDYVHQLLPKTYIAHGILGVETETGDMTVEPLRLDESEEFKSLFSQMSKTEIEEKLKSQFIGEYLQAPHAYSAAKFKGKKLHEWAREGVHVEKDAVKRHVYEIKVLEFQFPNISIEYKVSSGTYIRTLFNDCAKYLGSFGTLERLVRTKVGNVSLENALKHSAWPEKDCEDPEMAVASCQVRIDKLFDLESGFANDFQIGLLGNGLKLDLEKHHTIFADTNAKTDASSDASSDARHGSSEKFVFIYDLNSKLHSFCRVKDNQLKVIVNLYQS